MGTWEAYIIPVIGESDALTTMTSVLRTMIPTMILLKFHNATVRTMRMTVPRGQFEWLQKSITEAIALSEMKEPRG